MIYELNEEQIFEEAKQDDRYQEMMKPFIEVHNRAIKLVMDECYDVDVNFPNFKDLLIE